MKSVIRSIKNEINNYDEGERLVRELTSNESTPPSTQMLIKLKIMLTDQYQFLTVVRMLFKRLKDYNNIRHVEKALICIEYLLKHADRKFVRYCQVNEKSMSKLMRYRYILNMQDYGHNIRKRAKRIVTLLKNDDKLRQTRAEAQGYSMKFSKQQKQQRQQKRNKSNNKYSSSTSTKTARKSNGASSKSKSSDKKKKPKKKKTKKKTETAKNDNKIPKEPQYESFIDVPPDNTTNQPQQQREQADDYDLTAQNWWKQENEDPFQADNNDDDFGWYQSGDAVNDATTGFGDDGGEFGFGGDDDFANENKEDDAQEATADAESWMSTLTAMDNVLDANIKKTDTNKRNKKGSSMAQLAKSKPAPKQQTMPNAFGTDDFFNQNASTNNSNANGNNDNFDPFGLDSNKPTNSSSFSHLYQNNNNKNANNNAFGGGGAAAQNTNFGYQGKQNNNPYSNDPFAGIANNKQQTQASGSLNGVQPAAYVPS
eukprot:512828_1